MSDPRQRRQHGLRRDRTLPVNLPRNTPPPHAMCLLLFLPPPVIYKSVCTQTQALDSSCKTHAANMTAIKRKLEHDKAKFTQTARKRHLLEDS